MDEELRVQVIQAGEGRTLSRCVSLGGGGMGKEGFSHCLLTGWCRSRAEFLSLLKNYNCFLKEQTQLHLSYAHVRLLLPPERRRSSSKCLSVRNHKDLRGPALLRPRFHGNPERANRRRVGASGGSPADTSRLVVSYFYFKGTLHPKQSDGSLFI